MRAGNRAENRSSRDFYVTPEIVVSALLDAVGAEYFEGKKIHDPCCGQKPIGDVFRRHGLKISEHSLHVDGVNFFEDKTKRDVLILNPPYNFKNEFIAHSLTVASEVWAILPAFVSSYIDFSRRFLFVKEYAGRISIIPRMYMLQKPQTGREFKRGGNTQYCWFCWQKPPVEKASPFEIFVDLDNLVDKISNNS